MTPEEAGKLRTVRLEGFAKAALNEEYLEGPGEAFALQGRETYWQASGEFFMYYCQRFRKWRIAGISGFGRVKSGDCLAFASDGAPDRDILAPELIKGWIEVENQQWVLRKEAGVVHVGTLADQLAGAEPSAEGECEAEAEAEEALAEGSEPFAEASRKPRTSKCPAKWVAKKVADGVVELGKWVRRLFPSLLAAPPEDAAQPAS